MAQWIVVVFIKKVLPPFLVSSMLKPLYAQLEAELLEAVNNTGRPL